MWFSFLRFKRLSDTQNNYLLLFLSSSRWMSLRLEIVTNLMALTVALFVVFGISSAPYSYKAMAISLILQVREGCSSAGAGLVARGQTQGSISWDFDHTLGFGRL